MRVRSLAYRTDLALLQLGGSTVEDRGDRLVVRTPHNPTFHWGNFVLLEQAPAATQVPALLAELDETFPDSHHRAIGIDGTAEDTAPLAPLQEAGLAVEVSAAMTARSTQPPPRPNDEASYRPLVTDEDWRQRVELSARCNEDHPAEEYRAFITARSATDRSLTEASHGAWWGAFLGGRLVSSLGLLRAGDGLARFQTVETDPDFRGRGLAGTLVHRASQWGLRELGAETLVMVADPGYLAIRVYRTVGFAETQRQVALHQPDRLTRP